MMSATIITSVITAFATALATAVATFLLQERRLKFEFAMIRTEFMAEQVARQLLEHPEWRKRTFRSFQRRLGGFGDDELRKILVRAGAVRFIEEQEGKEPKELWGLISRNQDVL